MSEPTSTFPATIEWEPSPQPQVWITRPPRTRWWLYVLFLLLTFFSTTVVGARLYANFSARQPAFSFNDDNISLFPVEWLWQSPQRLIHGFSFSLALMFILFAHEMGHYLYARYYRVEATPPFFIPFPSLIGTLGAFIRIKGRIPTRAALFDIGIAGPIAGFIPSCVAVFAGLSLSRPLMFRLSPDDIAPGFPLAFHLAGALLHVPVPLSSLTLHPIAVAGWVGMFATALNLLPGGQLDGGHILYSAFPRLHRWVTLAVVIALIPLAKYFWIGWLVWAAVLYLTSRHPAIPKRPPLSPARKALAGCALAMLFFAFTPAPITGASGREKWPDMRDWGAQKAHFIRHELRQLVHRR